MNQPPLVSQVCKPCTIGTPPLTKEGISQLLPQLSSEWKIVEDKLIQREFSFRNFQEAVDFINKVAALAETENHHPDIYLHNWRKVRIDLSTHKIKGLSENDFILAAKIDKL